MKKRTDRSSSATKHLVKQHEKQAASYTGDGPARFGATDVEIAAMLKTVKKSPQRNAYERHLKAQEEDDRYKQQKRAEREDAERQQSK